MHACSRQIKLSNGVEFETPLLVPALSSRAVGPVEVPDPDSSTGVKLIPSSRLHSDLHIRGIDEALLISAYDVHHELIDESEALRSGFARSRYAVPSLLIIDSGWYEKSGGPLAGQFFGEQDKLRGWEREDYESTIDGLDSDVRAVVVSWDHSGTYGEQIALAQDFFGAHPRFPSTILLKAPGKSHFHRFSSLPEDEAANLRAFEIIGVTEKELGNKVLDRLVTLADLREKLTRVGVGAPIHVFGGLEPMYTPLYFAAGAEVFDGLGWLRYAYKDGRAIYRDAAALLSGTVNLRRSAMLTLIALDNLKELQELSEELRRFADKDGDWSKLRTGDDLRPTYESFEAKFRRSRGR